MAPAMSRGGSATPPPLSGSSINGTNQQPSSFLKTLGFDEDEENIEPQQVPDDDNTQHLLKQDFYRGTIHYGLLKQQLDKLQQATAFLRRTQGDSNEKMIAELEEEIRMYEQKIEYEQENSDELSDRLNTIKNTQLAESESIQQEISKLSRFCDHFRSQKFMSQFNEEAKLRHAQLELEKSQELGVCLESRLKLAKEKNEMLKALTTSLGGKPVDQSLPVVLFP